ncbi:unnamed protein product [Amoebophrya sp. A25]|nr:unnamed protein product [Amoebophrya sp. A25]|eukprot:GSA25T00023589001.1
MDAFQQQLLKLAEANEKAKDSSATQAKQDRSAVATDEVASSPETTGAAPTTGETENKNASLSTGASTTAPKRNPLGLPTMEDLRREAELEKLCRTLISQLKSDPQAADSGLSTVAGGKVPDEVKGS